MKFKAHFFPEKILTLFVKIVKNKLMKILIVEDDNSIRDVLRMSLESENFVVDEASDGDSGSFMAKVNVYDLIILDFVLPNKNGGSLVVEGLEEK